VIDDRQQRRSDFLSTLLGQIDAIKFWLDRDNDGAIKDIAANMVKAVEEFDAKESASEPA
jgi:hypothetical protein